MYDIDCAVCLQKCHHPTQLPCGHIFCFLCVKGVTIQSKKCAMCRADIPSDYLDHPVLLEKLSLEQTNNENNTEEYQWYYEGRNGWWKYDERSNNELETAFNASERDCILLLAGALYCIDFQNMIQVRRNDPTRRRRVKRDVPSLPAKGIAGIKIVDNRQVREVKNENENNSTSGSESLNEVGVIEILDEELITGNSNEENSENNESSDLSESFSISHIVHNFSAINLREQESHGSHNNNPDADDLL